MHDRFEQITTAAAETCEWVWSTAFDSWLKQPGDNEIFWITGKPGSGKSTLMKYLVKARGTQERLPSETNGKSWKIVHFFYNFRASTSLANREEGMLRSVLEQILQTLRYSTNAGMDADRNRINAIAKESFDTDEDIASAIVKFLQLQAVNVLLLVDGLDECGSNLRHMVTTLKHIQTQTDIRLCLASRPEPMLTSSLSGTKQIKMQELNSQGIQRYTNVILKEIGSLLELPSSSIGALLAEVTTRADGVFLFVHFTFEMIVQRLVQGLTIAEISLEIRQMPQELSMMYDRIFDGVPLICRSEVAFVLDLVQHYPSPLHLDTLFRAWIFFRNRLEHAGGTNAITTLDSFKMRLLGLLGTVLDLEGDDSTERNAQVASPGAAELSANIAHSKHARLVSLANLLPCATRQWPRKDCRNRQQCKTVVSLMHETVYTYIQQENLWRGGVARLIMQNCQVPSG